MEYTNPLMIDTEKAVSLIKKIRKQEIFDADDLNTTDKFLLISLLCPQVEKKVINSSKSNYGKLKEGSLGKELPNAICGVFLESLWWEVYGTYSQQYLTEQSETTRFNASVRKRFRRYLKTMWEKGDELVEREEELEERMSQKGLIRKDLHEEQVEALTKQITQMREDHAKEMERQKFSFEVKMNREHKEAKRWESLYKDFENARNMPNYEPEPEPDEGVPPFFGDDSDSS